MCPHVKCVPLYRQSLDWNTSLTEGELVGAEVVGDMLGEEEGDF